ncbi:uncharacterized protein LOC113464732 [Ceratina calcarata]|uniref:Uncharacterized protein LOC113464732 n=1 Tax=Ceratina calcarata TaxID=156304 RepID=A0AAJ7S5W9_9HYME|nr:uncharacterized protein LOC113464732 [Ceratina calcarata]
MTWIHMAWIQELRKEELAQRLAVLGEDNAGGIAELRARFRDFVRAHPDDEQLRRWKTSHKTAPLTNATTTHAPPTNVEPPTLAYAAPRAIDQIRKWNCHFQGKDLPGFVERIGELRRAYRISDEDLLLGLPELLRGTTLNWFRNREDDWDTWEDFIRDLRNAYEPPFHQALLQDRISARRQRPREPIQEYVTDLQTMFHRLGTATPEQVLDRALLNMTAEYQMRIKPSHIRTLDDLVRAGKRIEMCQQRWATDAQQQRPTRPIHRTATACADMPFDRDTCCWRCKQPGHTRRGCTAPRKIFCSYCGTDGTTYRECACARPGNEQRAGAQNGVARPNA